jgi:hypothetical protein
VDIFQGKVALSESLSFENQSRLFL